MKPISFAQALYPKQQEIMDHPARIKVVAFGRQAGKSFMAKRLAIIKAANEGKRVLITFPSINSSRTHWREMVRQLRKYEWVQIKQASKEMIFANGGSIDVRTVAEPENLRGGTYDLIICDEAAFYPDGETLFVEVIQPMITASKGSILLISSPAGKNWFYHQFNMQNDPQLKGMYKSWKMRSADSPFQDKETLEIIKTNLLKRGQKSKWLQEYEAEFVDSVSGLFAGYGEVSYAKELDAPEPFQVYVAAVDWGMGGDDTVITIFNKYTRQQVKTVRFKSDDPVATVEILTGTIKTWQPISIAVEWNGMGQVYYKLLENAVLAASHEMIITPSLIPVHQTNDLKRNLVERVSLYIIHKVITFLDDPAQSDQFSNFIKRTMPDGSVKYEGAKGYNDDLVMVCLMAADLLDKIAGIDYESSADIPEHELISPFQD